MDAVLAALGLKPGAALAGLLGGVASFRFLRELQWFDRLFTASSGIPCGIFSGSALAEVFGWGVKTEWGVIFLLSAIGMSVIAAVLKALPEIISSARERWIGPKGGES